MEGDTKLIDYSENKRKLKVKIAVSLIFLSLLIISGLFLFNRIAFDSFNRCSGESYQKSIDYFDKLGDIYAKANKGEEIPNFGFRNREECWILAGASLSTHGVVSDNPMISMIIKSGKFPIVILAAFIFSFIYNFIFGVKIENRVVKIYKTLFISIFIALNFVTVLYIFSYFWVLNAWLYFPSLTGFGWIFLIMLILADYLFFYIIKQIYALLYLKQ